MKTRDLVVFVVTAILNFNNFVIPVLVYVKILMKICVLMVNYIPNHTKCVYTSLDFCNNLH